MLDLAGVQPDLAVGAVEHEAHDAVAVSELP